MNSSSQQKSKTTRKTATGGHSQQPLLRQLQTNVNSSESDGSHGLSNEELFQRADLLMFKDRAYERAERIYRQICERDPQNVDAITSLALCVKMRRQADADRASVFLEVADLYQQALKMDPEDIEANFNMAILYLAGEYQQTGSPDYSKAMHYLQQAVKKDMGGDLSTLLRPQFVKCYFNQALIHDRLGDLLQAQNSYRLCLDRCEETEALKQLPIYFKARTNYAVTLEKLGKRDEALKVLQQRSGDIDENQEVRVLNNLGIIQKRQGTLQDSERAYNAALDLDPESFFPNYNMGVLKAQQKEHAAALNYLSKSLQLARQAKEEVYETNVLINLAMVNERMKNYAEAIQNLELVIKLQPQNQKIKNKVQQLSQLAQEKLETPSENLTELKRSLPSALKKDEPSASEFNTRPQDVLHAIKEEHPKTSLTQSLSKNPLQPIMDGVRTSTANSRQSTMQRKAKLETVIREINTQIEIITGDYAVEIKDINKEMERQESQKKVLLDLDQQSQGSKEDSYEEIKDMLDESHSMISNQLQNLEIREPALLTKEVNDKLLPPAGKSKASLTPTKQIPPEELSKVEQLKSQGKSPRKEEDKPYENNIQMEGTEQSSQLQLSLTAKQALQDAFLGWSESECLHYLKQGHQSDSANLRLGLIYLSQDRLLDALTHLKRVSSGFRVFLTALKVADILYRQDKTKEALQSLERAQSAGYGSDADVQALETLRGKCLDRLKRFPEAITAYQSALVVAFGASVSNITQLMEQAQLHYRLGWVYVRQKSVEQGIDHLRKALLIIEKDLPIKEIDDNVKNQWRFQQCEVMTKLASVLLRELPASADEAEMLCKKSLKLNPKDQSAHLLLAKIYDIKGQLAEAIEAYNSLLKLQSEVKGSPPPKPTLFFNIGCLHEKAKDFKKAVLNYKKCLTLDPKHFGACIHLANLLANVGEGQRAAKYFKHAIKVITESDPTLITKDGVINAYFGLGKTLQQYSDNKDAPLAPLLKVVQDLDPKHYKAHTQLGILYLDREEYEKSAEHLKHALLINRGFPLALVSMGNLLFETGHAEEAIRYHKQALTVNEKELQALIGLGNAYYDSQRPHEAVNFYRKALDLDPQLADVHYNLGNALYLIEDIQQAVEHYRSAIALNPKKAESHYNLGNALCVKADYPAAISAYQAALDLDPRNAPALYNLGNAFYMINRFEDAIRVYVKALEINEKSAECHFNLASAYNDLGDHQRAIAHYLRSLELDESNIDAYVCMGGVLENMKAPPDKAERYYRMALEKEPGNQRALDALKKIKTQKKQ